MWFNVYMEYKKYSVCYFIQGVKVIDVRIFGDVYVSGKECCQSIGNLGFVMVCDVCQVYLFYVIFIDDGIGFKGYFIVFFVEVQFGLLGKDMVCIMDSGLFNVMFFGKEVYCFLYLYFYFYGVGQGF